MRSFVSSTLPESRSACVASTSTSCHSHRGYLPQYTSTCGVSLGNRGRKSVGKFLTGISSTSLRLLHSCPRLIATQASSNPNQAQLQEMLQQMMLMMQEAQKQQAVRPGDCLLLDKVSYHPPGAPTSLLTDVSFRLPPKSLGLIYGRSGSGKTTLLNVVAGLLEQSTGNISIQPEGLPPTVMPSGQRLAKAGMVFQFPERHFLGGTILEEMAIGISRDVLMNPMHRQMAFMAIQSALQSVGMASFPLDTQLRSLSDGYKRRLALAVQLVRKPSVILLDEPLAGLDWKARKTLAGLLGSLRSDCSILAVTHDLQELSGIATHAFEMFPGGTLKETDPSTLLSDMQNVSKAVAAARGAVLERDSKGQAL